MQLVSFSADVYVKEPKVSVRINCSVLLPCIKTRLINLIILQNKGTFIRLISTQKIINYSQVIFEINVLNLAWYILVEQIKKYICRTKNYLSCC